MPEFCQVLSIFREIKHIDTIWNNKYTHTFHTYIFLSLDGTRTVTDAEQGPSACHFSLTANYQHSSGFFPSTLLILISAALYSFVMLGWVRSNIFVHKKRTSEHKNLTGVQANFFAESSSPVFELCEEKNTFFIQKITYVISISCK